MGFLDAIEVNLRHIDWGRRSIGLRVPLASGPNPADEGLRAAAQEKKR
jgi:hypothetical protein